MVEGGISRQSKERGKESERAPAGSSHLDVVHSSSVVATPPFHVLTVAQDKKDSQEVQELRESFRESFREPRESFSEPREPREHP